MWKGAWSKTSPTSFTSRRKGRSGLPRAATALPRGPAFTTSYHTRFPEYLAARVPAPSVLGIQLRALVPQCGRGRHGGVAIAVRGTFRAGDRTNVHLWSRGVDLDRFRPRAVDRFGLPRPLFLYAGRVAVEKNLEAFLSLDLPGSKAVVGGGPQLEELKRRYPERGVHRPEIRRRTCRALCFGGRFRFPEPDRHLRQRAAGGAGLRRSRRRL